MDVTSGQTLANGVFISSAVDEQLYTFTAIQSPFPGAYPKAVAEFDRSQLPGEFWERDFAFMASYYNTPEWKALRSQTLKRDNYTCQNCGKIGQDHNLSKRLKLTAHHIIERSEGGADALENLETLCATCHPTLHRQRYVERKSDISEI